MWEFYSNSLKKRPLATKTLTSGVTYGLGDIISQVMEQAQQIPFRGIKIDWQRCANLFVFGILVSGPCYHYWFNYLDKLPGIAYELRKSTQKWEAKRAFHVLKQYNVQFPQANEFILPKPQPHRPWVTYAMKIAMDQLIFSTG